MMCAVVTEETSAYQHAEAATLQLRPWQAAYLHEQAEQLSRVGGPQSTGVKERAEAYACRLRELLEPTQCATIDRYAANCITLLVVEGMRDVADDLPAARPALDDLKRDPQCLVLASRNQILLNLVGNRAFAYDLDYNEMVRIVGNFKGGGTYKIKDEPLPENVELSSHSGLALGAHTEPPYYCSFHATERHSPAPSTLILTARWNPLHEPTVIIPIAQVLRDLGEPAVHALTQKHYRFTRPNSYIAGEEDGVGVSILDFNNHGDYALRFSAYRFSACDGVPESSQRAIEALKAGLAGAEQIQVTLDPSKAILINNTKALHCRDIIKDNRRILVRLFGYNRFSTGLVQSTDPMLVKG
ncbi:MAG: hypothetical protein H7138_08005 [Myxococcales bacterium]|nr:hypothetical protein [Myxococcales bacterium]